MSVKEESDYVDMTGLVFSWFSLIHNLYKRISLLLNGKLTYMVYMAFPDLRHIILNKTFFLCYFIG